MGFGRSYGKESRFLTKKSLGIFQSKIWDALERKKSFSTTAFVTDIGNDLAYEVPVDQLIEWVEGCVNRLQSIDAKVVLTNVPLAALQTLGEVRYRILRTLFFPQCRLDLPELLNRAERLSKRLHQLAKTKNIPIFSGDSAWCGFDPIHPRRANLPLLWREIFNQAGLPTSESAAHKNSWMLNCYLRGLRCEKRSPNSFFGGSKQPDGRLIDGTEIAIY